MIIKRKYTNVKKLIEEPVIDNDSLVEQKNQEPSATNVENNPEEDLTGEILEENNDEKVEEVAPTPTEEVNNVLSLDDALENIQFEQREERREGSRRRGYRRTQDRNILTRAQEEAVSIKEAAKQEGYNEGIKNANSQIEELKSTLQEFYSYKDNVYDNVSGCILDIAVEIAKKILNKEVEADKEVVLPLIKSALEEVNKTENKITLKVMPKDVQIVKDKLPEILDGDYSEAKVIVLPEQTIEDGGVIVETSNGLIDATIKTQIAIIEKALISKEDK